MHFRLPGQLLPGMRFPLPTISEAISGSNFQRKYRPNDNDYH
jgi:hypothetical protein